MRFQIYRGTSPCKECTRRKLGCHGDCTDYLAFHLGRLRETEVVKENKRQDKLQMVTECGSANRGGF